MYDVVIVGGGAAGVAALVQLVQSLSAKQQKATILLVEKSKKTGEGLSYSTSEPDHILNLSADIMSAEPGKPDSFSQWLNRKNIVIETQYPPRQLFGQYLQELFEETKACARASGIRVEVFNETEALSIESASAEKLILLSTKGSHFTVRAKQILLCLGHLPTETYTEFKNYPNYFHSVWDKQKPVTSIPSDQTVYIVGSRLTAIDTVLELVAHGHRGKVIMMSRSGLLPCVIGQSKPYVLTCLTENKLSEATDQYARPLSLDVLVKLFWAEISAAEGHTVNPEKILHPSISSEEWLRREIVAAETSLRPWQSVLIALYPLVPKIWSLLKEEDQQRFMEEFYSPWMTYLAAFPLDSARKVLRLLESGQLEVKAHLEEVTYLPQAQQFEFKFEGEEVVYGEYLINGIGQGYDVTRAESLLLQNMLQQRLLVPHPLGGVRIDRETLAAKGEGRGIFVVGELTRGEFLATTDLSQVVNQLRVAVPCILRNILAEMAKIRYNADRLFSALESEPINTAAHAAEPDESRILARL